MNILHFIRWLNGYVVVELKGENASSFFSFMLKNNFKVWNVIYAEKSIKLNLKLSDYLKIRNLRHNFKNEISIRHTGVFGVPFKVKNLTERKSLLVGGIIYAVILIILSGFVWTIEIVGNEKVKKDDIISAYSSLGVYTGMPVKSVDSYSLRDKLPLLIRDISWCSFNVEGTKLTINVTEIKETDKSDKEHYSNIIAASDGVIKQLDIISGNKNIHIGDIVNKGDLLISGAPLTDAQFFTHSKGKVIAETKKRFEIDVEKNRKFFHKTGKTEEKTVINFFGIRIPMYLDKIHFESESHLSESNVTWLKQKLPISFIKRIYFERVISEQMLDYDSALNTAKAYCIENMKNEEIISISDFNYSSYETEEKFTFVFEYKCLVDIGEIKSINLIS